MVRSNFECMVSKNNSHSMHTVFKNPIVFIFHTIIIIGKNNNINFADFGAKFTIMSNSLYITVVNIGNVHSTQYTVHNTEQKFLKLHINF